MVYTTRQKTRGVERTGTLPSRVSSKQTKKNSIRTETSRNKICFGCVSVCFVKPKTKNFGLFLMFWTYIATTETNRAVVKQTETNQNNPKFSEKYQNMLFIKFLTVSVGPLFVLVQSKHRNFLFRYRTETTETNCFETNHTNRKNPKNFLKKIPKYALCYTVLVALLFVSVQATHCFGIEPKQQKQTFCFG